MPAPDPYPINIRIGGLFASAIVRVSDLVITDVINEQPNTATLTANVSPHVPAGPPFYPPAFDAGAFVTSPTPLIYPAIRRGQPIEIYGDTWDPADRLFAGEIVSVEQGYDGDLPELLVYYLSCTDYTRALNRRKVTQSYGTQSATAIVLDLMASRLADGFTTAFVAPNLPALAIDFTFEDMNRALTRITNRIGGYWYVDYGKALHVFLEDVGDDPAPLVPGARFDDLRFETDLSQVRTRVLVEGMGTTVITAIMPGETIIPVRDPMMFSPTGGQAVIGQQRITYTGVVDGGVGSLVGPGVAPTVAPTVAAQGGAGIELGTHSYAVTFQTAAGESLPSPAVPVTLGSVTAPTSGPIPDTPTAGPGPNPGVHYYAVTFVTGGGETQGVAGGSGVTTYVPGTVGTPGATAAAVTNGPGSLPNGVGVRYETTFVTASGETLPGGASATITPTAPTAPPEELDNLGTDFPTLELGGGLTPSSMYTYWIAYLVGSWESALSDPFAGGLFVGLSTTATAVNFFRGFRRSSDPRVTGRRIYRSTAGGATPRLLATLNYNNPALSHDTGYVDRTADASLGAARAGAGAIGTPPGNQARVTLPAASDPRVTSRRIYRSDGAAAFLRLTTLADLAATEYLDGAASVAGQPAAPTTDTSAGGPICTVSVTAIPTGPPAVTGRRLYRTVAGGVPTGPFGLVATIANNTATTYTDTTPDGSLGAGMPLTNSTATGQVAITGIPTGPASVTGRKLYRTAANAAALKLLTTIANNTATTFTDTAADATLGAAIPTGDTSGLAQPTGQVNAGSTIIPVAGAAALFLASGGFAIVGNGEMVIRFFGVAGNALTGIPASGPGSLTATVAYNASITIAPAVTGVPASGPGAIARPLINGDEIYLLIVRDDLAAQAALAAIEGGDGVIEHFIQDRRLSRAGAAMTATAELALFAQPEIRVRYTTRDPRTRSGKVIAVNLPAPTNLVGEFLIQRVQLTRFHVPTLAPLRTVQASSTRFSFEDVLRRLSFEVSA